MARWEDWEQWLAEWHSTRVGDTLSGPYLSFQRAFRVEDGAVFVEVPLGHKVCQVDEYTECMSRAQMNR